MARIASEYTDNKDLEADPNLIFVFDDILPEWLTIWGEESMVHFEWVYDNRSYPGGEPFFGKMFLDEHTNRTLPPIVDVVLAGFESYIDRKEDFDFMIEKCVKILANAQLPCTPGEPHVDTFKSNHWTLVYHLNDSTGDTRFYKSQENLTVVKSVPFKRGRMILFPSFYNHEGCVPEKGLRISIGMQLLAESRLTPIRNIETL